MTDTPNESEMAAGLIHEPGTNGIMPGEGERFTITGFDGPPDGSYTAHEIDTEPVPMYAISEGALDEIDRALISLGIDDPKLAPSSINAINATATRALGFITAARENGPIPLDPKPLAFEVDSVGALYEVCEGQLKVIERALHSGAGVEVYQTAQNTLDDIRLGIEIEPPEPVNTEQDPRINFLGVQVESLIERLAASQVAAGLMTMAAAQGFVQKEAMPIRAVLSQMEPKP